MYEVTILSPTTTPVHDMDLVSTTFTKTSIGGPCIGEIQLLKKTVWHNNITKSTNSACTIF